MKAIYANTQKNVLFRVAEDACHGRLNGLWTHRAVVAKTERAGE